MSHKPLLLLQFFRSNQLYAGLLLIFYGFLLHLPAWWLPDEVILGIDDQAGVFGRWLNESIRPYRWLSITLPVVILFVTAIVANRLAFRERLSRQVTQFPGLFIILLSSLYPTLLGIHSMQWANLFMLFSIISIFRLYRAEKTELMTFNAGFWLGMAFLFNSVYWIYLLLLFVAVASLSSLSIKLLLRILVGSVTPVFLVGTYYYWQANLAYFAELQSISFHLPSFIDTPLPNLAGIVLLSSVLGFVIFKQNNNVKLLNIEGRKKINLLYWWLFISFFSLLFYQQVTAADVQLALVPLGILLSLSFSRGGKSAGEAGHLFLLLLAALLNLYLLPGN